MKQIKEEYKYLYFNNGKQKKKYMRCHNPQYLAEVRHINGCLHHDWVCAGNSCPYYAIGCNQ